LGDKVEKLTAKVYKISAGSNVYLLDFRQKVLIDTGEKRHREELLQALGDTAGSIRHVILTHLHYDHVGNIEMFPKAKIYASLGEIDCFLENPFGTVLDFERVKVIAGIAKRLSPAKGLQGLKIIPAPGHTSGSLCVHYAKEKVLFSGDTIFSDGFGRTDLPSSSPNLMQETLDRIRKIKYKILCPGHDY
jgi:hydroxyacylglutathione hydrolase